MLNRVQLEAEPPVPLFWFCWAGIIFIFVFRSRQMMTAVVASSPFTLPLRLLCYYFFGYIVIWHRLSCGLGLYVRTEPSLFRTLTGGAVLFSRPPHPLPNYQSILQTVTFSSPLCQTRPEGPGVPSADLSAETDSHSLFFSVSIK